MIEKGLFSANFAEARQGERGFTLIEMTIAIAVLLIGVISIVGISVNVSRANATSNALNVLATTAQDVADTLRAAKWTRIQQDARLAVGGDLNSNVANHFEQVQTPAGDMIVRWVVANGPSVTGDVRTITVKVVQEAPIRGLENGYTVSTIVIRN